MLHIVTSLAWLLLLSQLVFVRQHRFHLHRTIGTSIFFAGPVLVASLTLLTVHSAAKDADLQFFVAQTDRTKPLTMLVASIGRVPAFGWA